MDSAFQPAGKTFVIVANEITDNANLIQSDVGNVNQYRVYNSGVMTVFVTMLPTEGEVLDAVAIPEEDSPAWAVPVTSGAVEVFSGPDDAYVSVYTESGEAKVYITPGRGM